MEQMEEGRKREGQRGKREKIERERKRKVHRHTDRQRQREISFDPSFINRIENYLFRD